MPPPAVHAIPIAAAVLLSITVLSSSRMGAHGAATRATTMQAVANLRPHTHLPQPLSGPFAATPSGELFVSDGRRVHHVAAEGVVRSSWALGGTSGHGVVWAQTGLWTVSDDGLVQHFGAEGTEHLHATLGGPILAHPLLGPSDSLLVAHGGALERIDTQGRRTALLQLKTPIGGLSAVSDGALAAVSHGGQLCEVAVGDLGPTPEPRCAAFAHRFDGPPLLTPDRVVAGADDGHVLAVDRATLQPRFQQQVDGHVRGGLALSGPRLLLQTFGPRPMLLALDPRRGTLRSATPLGLLDHASQGARTAPVEIARDRFLTLGPGDAALLTDALGRALARMALPGAEHGHIVRGPDGRVYVGAGTTIYTLELLP